jgi:predicted ester cyclase
VNVETSVDQEAELHPSAYAPYRNPRDYILSWTDAIWVNQAAGLIRDHYAPNVKVHTAYAETYDRESVIRNSIQKMSAFPNGGGGMGEDVIWEQRGETGFISSHRVLKSGTHRGFWNYGPPTGRDWISRTVAHCLVRNGVVVEEWLARDEYKVLTDLGFDPAAMAKQLAISSPITGKSIASPDENKAFSGRITDPFVEGVSGVRPRRFERECRLVQGYFDEVWNARRFDRTAVYTSQQIVCHTVRMRRVQGIQAYQFDLIDLIAAIPDAKIELRDLAVNDSPDLGLRLAAVWLLRGTYSGVPAYGPVNRAPVALLGASHFELQDGKILREWRVYDEVAAMAQIAAAEIVRGIE